MVAFVRAASECKAMPAVESALGESMSKETPFCLAGARLTKTGVPMSPGIWISVGASGPAERNTPHDAKRRARASSLTTKQR
jgi:hypothetical protein